jgi:effector-binding domain-containing protein
VREIIPTYNAISPPYGKLASRPGRAMASASIPVAVWHDREHKENNVDAEAGFCLRQDIPATEGVDVREQPETTAACTVHNGSYQRLGEAYDALLRWVASNGYQPSGPIRELYLHSSKPVRQDDESYVTEIQVPVQKAAAEV